MTSKEYVIWLKGFVEACHEYAPTPKQWDALKDKLAEVTDEVSSSFPFGTPIEPVINPFPRWQHPHYPNPLDNPYRITCSSGSFGTEIRTTPGTGFVTISNPNLVSFGSGSYNPSTSTTYSYPSGSAWNYTNNTYNPPYTTGNEADYIKKETHNED